MQRVQRDGTLLRYLTEDINLLSLTTDNLWRSDKITKWALRSMEKVKKQVEEEKGAIQCHVRERAKESR